MAYSSNRYRRCYRVASRYTAIDLARRVLYLSFRPKRPDTATSTSLSSPRRRRGWHDERCSAVIAIHAKQYVFRRRYRWKKARNVTGLKKHVKSKNIEQRDGKRRSPLAPPFSGQRDFLHEEKKKESTSFLPLSSDLRSLLSISSLRVEFFSPALPGFYFNFVFTIARSALELKRSICL